MHEMSIAAGIVDIATQTCKKEQKSSVKKIALEIGYLSGVQLEALDFVWPVAVEGTVLENAERIIERIEGKAKCLDCDSIFSINNFYDCCPKCESYIKQIMQGKELKIKYLEV